MTKPTKPTIDATSPLAIRVTEADQAAVRCSPTRCVLANGCARQRGVVDQRVGAGKLYLHRADRIVRYDIDASTQAAIKAYDTAGLSIPIGFVARFVPPRVALRSRAGSKPGTNTRSGDNTSVATRRPSHRHLNVEPIE